jgi:hypothetical protein
VFSGLAILTIIALGFSTILAVIMISLLRCEFKKSMLHPLLFAGGFLAPVVLAVVYWFLNGAEFDFLDAILLHSLAYASVRVSFLWSLKNRALNIFLGLFISGMYNIAGGAFVLYVLENYRWFLARLRQDREAFQMKFRLSN